MSRHCPGKGGSAAISALKGIGRVGKTALAVKIGYRLTVQFPDAQLLIDPRSTGDAPMAAMESVIRRFHPEGQLPDDGAAALGNLYGDRRPQRARVAQCFAELDTKQI